MIFTSSIAAERGDLANHSVILGDYYQSAFQSDQQRRKIHWSQTV